ncbi:MAG: DNA polymerase [Deltaproteobacteria bacterium]|nr:DNA polymerase [Deltaproteobacteria bacterium]
MSILKGRIASTLTKTYTQCIRTLDYMLGETGLKFVDSSEEADHIVKEVSRLPILAVDIFFRLEKGINNPALLLAGNENIHYVFDLRRCGPDALLYIMASKNLKVMSSAYEKILNLYQHQLIRIENITDILILEQLITNNYFFPSEVKSLDDLSEKYLGFKPEKGRRILIDNLDGEISLHILEYLRIELLVIYKIFLEQVRKIRSASLERISRIESNLIKSLAKIQHIGIHFNMEDFLKLFSSARDKNLLKDDSILDEKEVARLFNYGVKENTYLDNLLRDLEKNYKDPARVLSQNANELLKRVRLPESRIHSRFVQISSASGRTSSQTPNLFAVPKARIFREFFSAPHGRVIITLDFSTFELGVLAALSKDPHFLKAFREKLDLHAYVAQLMFSKKVSKTENPELRRRAKAINFGIIYGMTAQGLAKRLEISKPEAIKLINTYYMIFPSLNSYIQNTISLALQKGELRTLAGRRCLLSPFVNLTEERKKIINEINTKIVKSSNMLYSMLILKSLEEEYFKKGIGSEEMYVKRLQNVISEGEPIKRILRDMDVKTHELYRFIRNMPVQGTAADIMKLSISMIDERLSEKGKNAYIINIVHDEILIEAGEEEACDIAYIGRETMKEASRQILKEIEIDVEVNIGRFWGDSSLNYLMDKAFK